MRSLWIGLTFADSGSGETAGPASALLEVEAPAAAPHTKRVRLVPALTEAPCALALPPKNTTTKRLGLGLRFCESSL